jgi:HK97 family phage portal protein
MRDLGVVLASGGPPPYDDYWYGPRGVESASGVTVNMETTISWSAMYAAVSYVSEDIGKVPLNMYERLDRGKQPAPDHELQARLHDQPNQYQSALEWREMMTAIAILRAEAISEQRYGRRGLRDGQIVPLHPDLLRRDTNTNGVRRIWYRDPLKGGQERLLMPESLVIMRGRLGRGIIDLARDSIGYNLALQRHSGQMFSRGARFQGVVQHPKSFNNDIDRKRFRSALNEYALGGPRSGRPLLLEDGMTWDNASMTAAEAEQLGQMRFGVTEASRWVRIPPHKLFELEKSTNNNIAHQSIEYVTDGLFGWAKRWEQAIYRDLLRPGDDQERFFAEHILDALMRGDPEARSKAYAMAIQWGWMTRNEVRERENLNALEGLDEPLTPLNMTTGEDGETKVLQFAPPARLTAAATGQLRLLASDAASRVVRREMAAAAKLAERTAGDATAWRTGIDAIYAEHGEFVADALHIPEHVARRYAREQRASLLADGPAAMDDWLETRVATLADLAMDQEALAA